MKGSFMLKVGEASKKLADGAGVLKDYASSATDWGVDKAKEAGGVLNKYGEEFMKGFEGRDTALADKYKLETDMSKGLDKIVKDTEALDIDKTLAEVDALKKGKLDYKAEDFSAKPDIPVNLESIGDKEKKGGGVYGALSRAFMNEDTKDKDKNSKDSGPTPPSLPSGRGPSYGGSGSVSGGNLGLGNATARDFLRNRFTNSKR